MYGNINSETGLLLIDVVEKNIDELKQKILQDSSKLNELISNFIKFNPIILAPKTRESFIKAIKEKLLFADFLDKMEKYAERKDEFGKFISFLLSSNDPEQLYETLKDRDLKVPLESKEEEINEEDIYNKDTKKEDIEELRNRLGEFVNILESDVLPLTTIMKFFPLELFYFVDSSKEQDFDPNTDTGVKNIYFSFVVTRAFLNNISHLNILSKYAKESEDSECIKDSVNIDEFIEYIKILALKNFNPDDYMASMRFLHTLAHYMAPINDKTNEQFEEIQALDPLFSGMEESIYESKFFDDKFKEGFKLKVKKVKDSVERISAFGENIYKPLF